MPSAKFILIKANNIQDQLLNNIMNQYRFLNIKIVNKNIYDFLHACTLAWVCSGTATLETALITTPMLIIYKTSFLTWFVSKLLIQLPYIGLVNIVAQEKIVPEFIQYQATTHRIAEYSLNFLKQKPQQQLMKDKLEQVKQKLGQPGANKRTAKIILDMFA